ncbi:MAG: penicillin-binding protein activator [Pseudomonadales bacterium]|nr:penicillin-binding protein activator [Pseudomonadales bacterium]
MRTLHIKSCSFGTFSALAHTVLSVLVIFISGCQSNLNSNEYSRTVNKGIVTKEQPYLEVSRLNQRAAESSPQGAAELYSQSINILLELQDLEYLELMLKRIDSTLISAQILSDIQLLRVQTLLETRHIERAKELITAIHPFNQNQRNHRLNLISQLQVLNQNYSAAASTLMQILPEQSSLQSINNRIWKNCSLSSQEEIEQQLENNKSRRARAWWTLALKMSNSLNLVEEQRTLEQWRRRNTSHYGQGYLPKALREISEAQVQSHTIALFIPLTGRLSQAGKAIREGFIAAHYHTGMQHNIRVYDTTTQNINSLYEQALAEQANIIVGPLQKHKLEELAQLPERRLPVLGLNNLSSDPLIHDKKQLEQNTQGEQVEEIDQIAHRDVNLPGIQDNSDTPAMILFSLAVEDEAKTVAQRTLKNNMLNIALISSPDSWSQRAATEFRKHLSAEQHIVAELMLNDVKSTTDKLGNALMVSSSMERNKKLQSVIKSTTEIMPRSRQDLDVVVAMIDGLKASALNAALKYHFAGSTPILAISQVTRQLTNANLGQLGSIEFTELPWRLNNNLIQASLINNNIGKANRALDPLYAIGADAYQLIDRLPIMLFSSDQHMHGGTGLLSINTQKQVVRQLKWATAQSGKIAYTNRY